MKEAELQKQIIQATIEVASSYDRYRFSMLDIAGKVGCSAFEIYHLFESKEKLVKACRMAIDEDCFSLAVKAMREGKNFDKTFLLRLDHYLSHPEAIRFALTYDYVFPRRVLPPDFAEYKNEVITKLVEPLDEILPSMDRSLEIRYQLTDHWVRDLAMDAELILDGVIPDTPAMRELMVRTVNQGLFSFPKIPESPE